jgi:outer membrane protein OmpA-like peptidoglycan-associated protein
VARFWPLLLPYFGEEDDMPSRSLFLIAAAALLLGACDQPQSQAVVAPSPPPPQPVASTYRVLFDTDRSTLSSQSMSTIQQAAATYRSRSGGGITVTGWADTQGSQDYNMALSQRRANAVTAALVGAGVPAASITTSASGETNLPQPTADQVPDQQNRSVLIAVGQTTAAAMSDAQYCQLLARKVRTDTRGTDPTGNLGKALSDCQTGTGNYGIPFMENYLTDNRIPLPSRYA